MLRIRRRAWSDAKHWRIEPKVMHSDPTDYVWRHAHNDDMTDWKKVPDEEKLNSFKGLLKGEHCTLTEKYRNIEAIS